MEAHHVRPRATTKRSKKLAFATITDWQSARAAARTGAMGGVVFAGLYVVALAMLVSNYKRSLLGPGTIDLQYRLTLGIEVACIVFALLLSWRVYTGRGYASAATLTLWFTLETVFKIFASFSHPLFLFAIVLYVGVLIALVEGFRGCWYGRRYRIPVDPATFD